MVFGHMYQKWGNITTISIDQKREFKLFHDHQNNTFVYQQLTHKSSKMIEVKLNLTHRYYNSYQGKGQTSGAYIFRPDPADAQSQMLNTKTPDDYETYYYKGKLVQEFWHEHQHTRMLIRLNNRGQIEVETFMRQIPLSSQGKQVTFNVETGFNNNNIFYTDSTGMAMQKRELNKRPQLFNYTTVQPISSNYFPLTSSIMFQQQVSKIRVSVFTDRSQGGGVIKPGRIQVMVNRRLYKDDFKGVNEPLNETNADGTKGLEFWVRHNVQIRDLGDDKDENNNSEVRINQPINMLFGKIKTEEQRKIKRIQGKLKLDPSIKLNLYPIEAGKIRVRLQNTKDAVNHDEQKSIKVDVKKLALDLYTMMNGQGGIVPKIVSLSLSGNQLYNQANIARNVQWQTEDGPISYKFDQMTSQDYSQVQLQAQEHRLFEIDYLYQESENETKDLYID